MILNASRGTNLCKNGQNSLKITVVATSAKSNDIYSNMLGIVGELITSIPQLGIKLKQGWAIQVPPNTPYMIMNTSNSEVEVTFSEDTNQHLVLWNPYLLEKQSHVDFNPDEFKKVHPVPDGYIDTLPKWYSVKFTYPNFNYIFVRPGLGISVQIHAQREEHWEILEGSPIIIANNKVAYNVVPKTKFDIPIGAMHTIINPTKDWVLLKETYSGIFDEKDIIRTFNPNNFK